jgi:hypothetical protein
MSGDSLVRVKGTMAESAEGLETLVLELVSGAGNRVHLQREKALARLEEALMRKDGEAMCLRAGAQPPKLAVDTTEPRHLIHAKRSLLPWLQ